MNGLETLKTIGAVEIFRRTHISVAEAKAILEKDFDYFNRAKALGFIKIIEREYDVDLSGWVAEFEEHKSHQKQAEEIFVYPKEEGGRNMRLGVGAVVAVIGILLVLLLLPDGKPDKSEATAAQPAQNALVSEAKEAIATPQPAAETLAPVEVAKPQEPEASKAPEFYISSDEDLWVGTYYSDNGQREGRIIKGRVDLDAERSQILTFGHGMFKLVYGDQTIEPKSGTLQRVRFRDGVLTQMPAPVLTPKTQENNQSTQSTGQTEQQ